jgi:hypothetical protein
MKFEIENLNSDLREAIEQAAKYLDFNDDDEVIKISDYVYIIGDTKYYIVDENETYVRVNEEADEYLDELIYSEVPEEWRDYIDRDAWFESHDAFTFEGILERIKV